MEKIMSLNRHFLNTLVATALLTVTPLQAEQANQGELKKEAVKLIKLFGGTLKPELKSALQNGGPAHAIGVCSEKAPEIAKNLSDASGWNIKRVSLKARNSSSAIPDSWEQKVLKQFDERQAKGESAKNMAYSEVVDGKYRFMKAQGAGKLCLTCHGAEVKPEVEAALKEKYPDDMARGYSLGQIRGAFSLTKDL
jgi:hypothetical protein